MASKKLTTKQVDNAKGRDKVYKLADGEGLYLEVHPSGARYWRGKYRHGGKEKRSAYGVFPPVGLEEARRKHAAARAQLREGVDPVAAKRQAKAAQVVAQSQTLEAIGWEWLEKDRGTRAASTMSHMEKILRGYLFPPLGHLDVRAITAPMLLVELRKLEDRGVLEIVSRVRQYASAIFRFAIASGRAETDPAGPLRDVLKTRKVRNLVGVKPENLGALVNAINAYDSTVVRLGMLLTLLTSARTIEVRGAAWSEFDLDRAEWTIPEERTKMRREHWMPLSTQAVAVLRQLQAINGHRTLVFPNERKPGAPMSENTLLYALWRCGYHHQATIHGFRSSMSTTMNELGYEGDVIERQLAHGDPDRIRGTYNKAEHAERRRMLVQDWADILDRMAGGMAWPDVRKAFAAEPAQPRARRLDAGGTA